MGGEFTGTPRSGSEIDRDNAAANHGDRTQTVKAKQRVMVRAEVFRPRLASGSVIEHPAYGDAIDRCGLDAEANDAASVDSHDQHDPVGGELVIRHLQVRGAHFTCTSLKNSSSRLILSLN